MTFKIQKGIPLPEPPEYRGMPLRDMEVGDSFVVGLPGEQVSSVEAKPYRQAYASFAQNSGYRFRSRKVEGGIRIWRVE